MKLAGTSPGAALVTLGCPMNQVDSERIMSGLISLGFEIVPEEEAEVIVVNTCGFISEAIEESIETIMSIADLKRSGNLKINSIKISFAISRVIYIRRLKKTTKKTGITNIKAR